MKKLFKSVLLLAVSAVAISACQKEINVDATAPDGDYIYSFAISNADNNNAVDTKASLGNDGSSLYLEWENGDSFGAYSTNGTNNSNNRPSTVSVSGGSYTLKVASTVELESGSTVYTYFPYNSGAGTDKTAAVIKIDPVQTQKSTGFDASVMPMAGEVYTTTTALSKDEETEVGEIRFANLGAIIEFNVYATSAIDEQIKSVQFNATSGNLAGNYTLDLTGIDFSDESTLALQGDGSEASVKTNLETPVAIPVSTTTEKEGTKIYMSIAPGDYTGTVVVTTTGHTYTFNVTSAKTFNRSKVKTLNANLSDAIEGDLPVEEVWEVVTSTEDFTAGTYVIVSSNKASYLVNSEKSSNPSSATAHWDGSGKLTSVTDDAKWIATASGTGLQFASYANTSNILWMSTSTAQGVAVAASTTITNAAKVWSLVENSTLGGESGYIATTGNSRYLALYTNGTWRGYTINATSGYLNNSSDIKAAIFYKLVDNRTALDTPVLTVNGTEVSWTSVANAGSYLVTIGSDEYTINSTSVDLDDYSLSDGEYSVSVVAVPSNTTQYKNSAAATTTVVIGNPSGTSTNPYTVAEALAAAGELATGGQSDDEVYISGIVSTVSSYSGTYKSITYYISDDGTTTDQFEVYSGKGLDGADFSAITDLAVGDEVTVKGYLKNFSGTLEVYQNNQIVTINYATRYTVTYSNDGNGLVSGPTSVGAQGSVTVTIAPNSGYELDVLTVAGTDVSADVSNNTYTFSMPASSVTVSATFKEKTTTDITETLTVGTNGNTTWTNGSRTSSATVGDVTFTALYSVANDGKYYSSDASWRFYTASDSGVKITVPSGKKITKVVITWKTGQPVTPSGFTASGTTSPTTYTADSETSVNEISFVRNSSANFLAQVIAVTYE